MVEFFDGYVSPTIIEERKLNVASMDVYSRLMMDRIIFLGSDIDANVANTINAQLLFLDSLNHNDITMYINSPGGSVTGSSGEDLTKKLSKDQAAKHDVRSFSSISAEQLKSAIKSYAKRDTWMESQADNIIAAAKASGIDPRFLVAMAAGENGWDKSGYHKYNNFFNIGAVDSNPSNAIAQAEKLGFTDEYNGWVKGAQWIKDNYITQYGQSSLYAMKNPTSVGAPDWHIYQTGPIDTKASIYSSLMSNTGGAGRGSNNSNSSILPYKLKSNVAAAMRPSIPDRLIYGRGGMISAEDILETSRTALNNKKANEFSDSFAFLVVSG